MRVNLFVNKKIFIIGSGGHAKVILDCLSAIGKFYAGFIEIDEKKIGGALLDEEIFSQDFFLKNYAPSEVLLVNGVGSVNVPTARRTIFLSFKNLGYTFLTLIHHTAYIAKNVVLGEGCQILANSILQIGCRLGDNVIVNTGAIVDHDCIIGHHSHIAPGAALSGGVTIEDTCHIGTSATLIQGLCVGTNSLVAAGAVVIADVAKNARVAGVPARRMR